MRYRLLRLPLLRLRRYRLPVAADTVAAALPAVAAADTAGCGAALLLRLLMAAAAVLPAVAAADTAAAALPAAAAADTAAAALPAAAAAGTVAEAAALL